MPDESKPTTSRFWPIVIGALILVAILVVASDYRIGREDTPTQTPRPSTEWTEAPEEGVEVNLPETPMRNVETGQEAETQQSEDSE